MAEPLPEGIYSAALAALEKRYGALGADSMESVMIVTDAVLPIIRAQVYAEIRQLGIVGAIFDRWERDLRDWDLEGATASVRAKRLAEETVADLIGGGETDG